MTKAFRIVASVAMVAGFISAGADGAGAQTTTTTPGATGSQAIAGVLTVDGNPVPDATVTVSQDGTEIGSSVSDETGAWSVPIPGRGTYQVVLDTDTLPEGVEAVRPELPSVRVLGSSTQRVVFRLTSEDTVEITGPTRANRFINLFVAGVRFGLIVGLCSVGLSMIYGTTGLVNFAHGELVTFGALVAFLMNTMTSGPKFTLTVAAVIGVLGAGLLGATLELGVWRPMVRRRSGAVARMLVSIGLALVLRYLYQVVFTGAPRAFRQYSAQSSTEFGPLRFPPRDYVVMAIAFVTLIIVGMVLQRTRLGTAVRAVSDERDLASASGIDVKRVVLVVWIGGSMLAGLGGVLLAVSQSAQWNLGFRLLLTMFAAIVLGGLGNPYGAMAGGLVVGIASQMSTYWLPADFQFAVALLILILVLLVRPQGILGVRERVG